MKRVAVIAAALGAVAVLAGGALVVGAVGGGGSSAVAVNDMGNPQDVRLESQKLFERFAGNRHQRAAGYVLSAYRQNGAMDACMDQAGYPQWDWSLSRQYATPLDALGSSIWFAEPMRRTYSENLLANGPAMAAERQMNNDEAWPAGYEAAIDSCLAHNPVEDPARTIVKPPGDESALVDKWRTVLREVEEEVADPESTYVTCMEDAPIPVLDDRNLPYEEIGQAMSMEEPAATDIPTGADDPAAESEGWKQYLAAEEAVIVADWVCRKDTYDAHIMELADVVEDFASEHADEIAELEQRWERVAIDAAALGYDGTARPLGQ